MTTSTRSSTNQTDQQQNYRDHPAYAIARPAIEEYIVEVENSIKNGDFMNAMFLPSLRRPLEEEISQKLSGDSKLREDHMHAAISQCMTEVLWKYLYAQETEFLQIESICEVQDTLQRRSELTRALRQVDKAMTLKRIVSQRMEDHIIKLVSNIAESSNVVELEEAAAIWKSFELSNSQDHRLQFEILRIAARKDVVQGRSGFLLKLNHRLFDVRELETRSNHLPGISDQIAAARQKSVEAMLFSIIQLDIDEPEAASMGAGIIQRSLNDLIHRFVDKQSIIRALRASRPTLISFIALSSKYRHSYTPTWYALEVPQSKQQKAVIRYRLAMWFVKRPDSFKPKRPSCVLNPDLLMRLADALSDRA